jgi:hypothetical protein
MTKGRMSASAIIHSCLNATECGYFLINYLNMNLYSYYTAFHHIYVVLTGELAGIHECYLRFLFISGMVLPLFKRFHSWGGG